MLCDATVGTSACPLCRRTDHPKTSRAKCSTKPSQLQFHGRHPDGVAAKEEEGRNTAAYAAVSVRGTANDALSVCNVLSGEATDANHPAQRSMAPTANIPSETRTRFSVPLGARRADGMLAPFPRFRLGNTFCLRFPVIV